MSTGADDGEVSETRRAMTKRATLTAAEVENLPESLNADQVAALTGLNRKTVYELAGKGGIPCRRVGSRVLFGRRAVLDWLNKPANE